MTTGCRAFEAQPLVLFPQNICFEITNILFGCPNIERLTKTNCETIDINCSHR